MPGENENEFGFAPGADKSEVCVEVERIVSNALVGASLADARGRIETSDLRSSRSISESRSGARDVHLERREDDVDSFAKFIGPVKTAVS